MRLEFDAKVIGSEKALYFKDLTVFMRNLSLMVDLGEGRREGSSYFLSRQYHSLSLAAYLLQILCIFCRIFHVFL